MNEQPKRRWGCLQWGVVGVVVVLGVLLLSSEITHTSKVSMQVKAVSNARQVIIALRQYASQRQGVYPCGAELGAIPDRPSSNRMFREMFTEGFIDDERIFGCPGSPFVPDNKIGEAPLFPQAMQPGENHWMLLRDQSDFMVGDTPILIENALTTTWPPRWDVAAHGEPRPGRAWKNGLMVIGLNDGSVQLCPILPDGTLDVTSAAGRNRDLWAHHLRKTGRPVPEYAPVEQAPLGRR